MECNFCRQDKKTPPKEDHVYLYSCALLVFNYFPFGFEGRMWDLIVPVPDHCLFFYFTLASKI